MSDLLKLNKEELYTYFENDFKPADLTDVFDAAESTLGRYYTEWRKSKGLSIATERESREAEVFECFFEFMSNQEIVEKTGLSTSSVYRYFKKWKKENPEEAAAYTLKNNPLNRGGYVGDRPLKPIKHIIKIRKKAIQLLHEGKPHKEIREMLGITTNDMERYVSVYRVQAGLPCRKDPKVEQKKMKAFKMFEKNIDANKIAKELNVSRSRISNFSKEFMELKLLDELDDFYKRVSGESVPPATQLDVLPNQLNIASTIDKVEVGDILNIYKHIESERTQFGTVEQGRPAAVLDVLKTNPYVLKVALITKEIKDLDNPCHVLTKASCLEAYSMILLEQIKMVQQNFFTPIGKISQEEKLKLIRTLEFFESRITSPSPIVQSPSLNQQEEVEEEVTTPAVEPEPIVAQVEPVEVVEAIAPEVVIEPTPKKKGIKIRQLDGEYASYDLGEGQVTIMLSDRQITVTQQELAAFIEELPDILKFLLT